MNKLLTLSIAAIALCAVPASAKMMVGRIGGLNGGGCMVENAQVTINFNSAESDVSAIQSKFDAKVDEIKSVLKDAGLDKFDLQSMNYNINPQNYSNMNSSYQFSGNMSFTLSPAKKATTVMQDLIKKGYQASVNVNSYRNGMPCPDDQKPVDLSTPTAAAPAAKD